MENTKTLSDLSNEELQTLLADLTGDLTKVQKIRRQLVASTVLGSIFTLTCLSFAVILRWKVAGIMYIIPTLAFGLCGFSAMHHAALLRRSVKMIKDIKLTISLVKQHAEAR